MTGNGVSRRRIIQIGGSLVVASGVGSTAAASNNDETNDQPAGVRTRSAHLSPDAPDIDVYVDGELVREGLAYQTVTDYRDLEPGTYNIQVVPTGEDLDETVLEETAELGDVDSTLAAIGEVAAENQPLEALTLEDDNSPVDPDTARVRVVHASPDAPAVDVVAGENGDALFENVAFGESGYTEVPEGEQTLDIYPTGEREGSVFEANVSLAGGTVYSAFAVGYLEPEDAPADAPFELLLTEDTLTEDFHPEEFLPAEGDETGWERDIWPGHTVSSELDSEDPTRFAESYQFGIEQGEPINMQLTRTGGNGRFAFHIVGPGNENWGSTIVRPDETRELNGTANQTGEHYVVIGTLPEWMSSPPFSAIRVSGEYTVTWMEQS